MEQANRIIENYLIQFKNDLKTKITELNIENNDKVCELLEYVWEYPKFTFQKQDSNIFNKKTEKKQTLEISQTNKIATEDLCIAKRQTDGVQCTRKKKKGSQYCGTHAKIERKQDHSKPPMNKMDVSAEDIHGIIYYIDSYNNVYHTEDILENRDNPRIIAKAVRHPDNTFTIPELFKTV